MLVAAAGNDGSTGGRFGTIASPAASPGWLGVGASDGRTELPNVDVALGTNGIQTGVDAVPLLGALSPKSDTPFPLVLPAGPTKSDGARAPADVVAGTDEGDFRATDGTSLVSGKAVLLPRDGAPIACARPRPAPPAPARSCSTATAALRRAPSGWTIA